MGKRRAGKRRPSTPVLVRFREADNSTNEHLFHATSTGTRVVPGTTTGFVQLMGPGGKTVGYAHYSDAVFILQGDAATQVIRT